MADLVYGLKASYRVNGRWIMNSKTAGTIRKLKDGDGRMVWRLASLTGCWGTE